MTKYLIQKEVGDRELFNKIAADYSRKDFVDSSMIARRYQLLAAFKPILKLRKKIGLIVDVGCGIGTAAKYLKGKYSSYIGIDQSKEEITLAKSFFKDKKIKFIAQNIKEINLSQKADVVLCLGALHHMTQLKKVFQVLKSLAKPGAILVAIEPQRSNFFVNTLRKTRKKLDRSYSKDQVYFEKEKLAHYLKTAGFEKISFDFQGFFSPYFAQVIIPPQIITKHLSAWAISLDKLLNKLPSSLKKYLAFNIVAYASFPTTKKNVKNSKLA